MPGDGGILHFGAIRVRVTGNGNLRPQMQGFDEVITQDLVPISMAYPDSRTKTRLANFQGQAGKLRLETTSINEVMRVNDITIFVKPLWVDFPA